MDKTDDNKKSFDLKIDSIIENLNDEKLYLTNNNWFVNITQHYWKTSYQPSEVFDNIFTKISLSEQTKLNLRKCDIWCQSFSKTKHYMKRKKNDKDAVNVFNRKDFWEVKQDNAGVSITLELNEKKFCIRGCMYNFDNNDKEGTHLKHTADVGTNRVPQHYKYLEKNV